MQLKLVSFLFFTMMSLGLLAQTALVSGDVKDVNGEVISGVSILLEGTSQGTISDIDGRFQIRLPKGRLALSFSHIQYDDYQLDMVVSIDEELNVILTEKLTRLKGVEVTSEADIEDLSSVINMQKVDAKSAKSLPSTFGDFNKVLVTLPGVSSNNELSSAYSVRGGNFDENLVYVNDIPVYRPFLANAGRQEGLSFVNPDMVQDIEFYAGGWEPKYGDKLSSSLNIEYKEPESVEGSATIGLLGGTAYSGGKVERMSYLIGVRHRDSRYLLNTLETEGEYFPTYTDVQSLFTFDLTKRGSSFINKTKLNVLLSYGRNRYLTQPTSRTTDFGSVQQNFRLQTAFSGQEILRYDSYQGGFRLTHRFNERLRSHLIASALFTSEKEQFEVEGKYRLCDVNNDPNSSTFDQCVVESAIGTNYNRGRNTLNANIQTIENRWEYLLNTNHILEAGVGITSQQMNDDINEYSFIDSSDYVHITSSIFNELELNANQYFGYLQNTFLWGDSSHAIASGVRVSYWNGNDQILVSPRISYRWAPKWEKTTTFKFSTGLYQQPPFYRELRTDEGELSSPVYAQKSLHFIGGVTRLFYLWKRPFLFTSDFYHKVLWDIIPYDIDNVRLRYSPDQTGTAFAQGIDLRVNGEFVKGTQSWFSVSYLRTREDIEGDGMGSVRRPTDQRINLGAFFEDHMPNDPTLRVYLNMVFGSGYPFGPPGIDELRNAFSGDEYYRVDVGMSKQFDFGLNNFFNKVWVRLEVLNALGADNTLSYTWIEDVNGSQFAIPNSLSARFLNIKFTAEL